MNRFAFSIIILLGCIVTGILFLWPRYEMLAQLQKEKVQKKTDFAYHEEYAAGLAALALQAEGKGPEIRIARNSLPNTQELPSLYEQIGVIAAESGLAVKSVSITPAQPLPSSQVKSIDIDLSAEGSYEALKQFIAQTIQHPRILTIKSFRLTSSAKQGVFQYSIQMEAYSY